MVAGGGWWVGWLCARRADSRVAGVNGVPACALQLWPAPPTAASATESKTLLVCDGAHTYRSPEAG